MGVTIRDLKGDGNWWVCIYEKGSRAVEKVGPDRKAAEERKSEVEKRMRRRAGAGPLPIDAVLEDHLAKYVERRLKHSTQVLQRGHIRNHLIPRLGDFDARELTTEDLEQFVQKIQETHSFSVARGCISIVRKAYNNLRRHYPTLGNPAAGMAEFFDQLETAEAVEIRSIDSWTHEEAGKLLVIAQQKEPRYYPILLTLLHTGCRRGEALGMQWRDFDWSNRRIWIRRARVNARTVLPKQRKRGSKPRSVRITGAMERVLGNLQEAQRHELRGDVDGWVFRSRMGTAIEETTLFRAWKRIRRLAAAQGVRPVTLHSLRHTFATLSLEAGKSVKWVSQQLGHRDASTTLNTYIHWMPQEETDLGYLPGNLGAGTGRHQLGTSTRVGSSRDNASA